MLYLCFFNEEVVTLLVAITDKCCIFLNCILVVLSDTKYFVWQLVSKMLYSQKNLNILQLFFRVYIEKNFLLINNRVMALG